MTKVQPRNASQNTYLQGCRLKKKSFPAVVMTVIRYVIDLQNGSLPVQITKFSNFCLEWNSRETRLLLEISHTQAKNIVCTVIQGDGFCKSCVSSVCIILPVILHFLTAKFAFHSFSLIPNLFLLFKRENILLIDRLSLTAH